MVQIKKKGMSKEIGNKKPLYKKPKWLRVKLPIGEESIEEIG